MARAWAILAGGFVLSVVLALTVDPWVSRGLRHLDPWVADIARMVDDLGDAGTPTLPLLVGIGGLLVFCRVASRWRGFSRLARWRAAARGVMWRLAFMALALAAAGAPCALLKYLVGRSRPKLLESADIYTLAPLTFDPDYFSYPSGHANTATAWCFALGLLIPGGGPWLAVAGFVIGCARVIHNAHFLGDVVFGAALAIFMTLWLRRQFMTAGLVFQGSGGWYRRDDPMTPGLGAGLVRLWRVIWPSSGTGGSGTGSGMVTG